MENGKETTFAGHNYKADYKYKVTSGQKANGENQLKEVRVEGDEWEPLIGIIFDIGITWYKVGKGKHLKMVSPFEKGHEPEI